MISSDREKLLHKIDRASVLSLDVFDTLIFRKTNTPETVFDLVGKHFGIHGFRKLRMDEQNEASRRTYAKNGYPHADMDEIYEVLSEHTEIPVDWAEVKAYEIALEKDALTANPEMLEIFRYAKEKGKRVVATSDMYLFAATLREILEANGYVGFDRIYCSADEHKAKFNKELFAHVVEQEQVPFDRILHIGDKERDDGEYPASFGMDTFVYHHDADLDKVKNAPGSDIDNGLYKILYDSKKGFWYNLGVEVGGPMYMGLYLWMKEKLAANVGKEIYFLSRDGYNLYQILRDEDKRNKKYLYVSHRSILLAGITEIDEEAMKELPPYTRGQTLAGIFNYLCISTGKIKFLKDCGFSSFEERITTDEEIERLRKLYSLNREVILERCQIERENALAYFESVGFLKEDCLVFDCGWNGSSQYLLERFKKATCCKTKTGFLYFGIKNTDKSRRQLHGLHYDAYAFDWYRNFSLQATCNEAVVLYELFFSAPHESVFYYRSDGVVFEEGKGDSWKEEILEGIKDYLRMGVPFAEKYPVEYSPQDALGHIQRLVRYPNAEEAVEIGNLTNFDAFARSKGQEKYIAYVTEREFHKHPEAEIYWMNGLFERPDITEELKSEIAESKGIAYPTPESPEYHLEDGQSIRNYNRWMQARESEQIEERQLQYRPLFSIVIPVYNTVTEQLREAIDSVLAQIYENYELILVDDCSSWENVRPVLQSYETNAHVHVIYRTRNGHISAATNDGIAAACGDYIVFMDCDDVLVSTALYEVAKKIDDEPDLDFIYSDEDKITEDGKIRHMPFFKPDWSPDLFLCSNYANHLSVCRTSIVKKVGGLRSAYNGSQDYDFVLRFMEHSANDRVGHISKILYHWRERKESVAYAMSSKNYATEAAANAKLDMIRRQGLPAHLEYIDGINQHRIVYEVESAPLVSIIIPSKDHPELLRQCITSIHEFTNYGNYEIVVVDNGSSAQNRQLIEDYLKEQGCLYVYGEYDFNFSKMCNLGAERSIGEYLLFLNDDIEVFQSDWLMRMLGHAQRSHVGAVGAKLYYPETTLIQHAGVANTKDGPSHSFLRWSDEAASYFGFNRWDYDCIAVTGACLLVEGKLFWQVGAFDEKLPVTYNDIDLCFRIHEAGYYNVVRNDVVAYHHESLSRGNDTADSQKYLRLSRERLALYRKHPELDGKDPYQNENLRRYNNVVFYEKGFDAVETTDVSAAMCMGAGYLDAMDAVERGIRFYGWSFIPERTDNANLQRYLILQDPYGKQVRIPAQNVKRPDILTWMKGRDDLLYSGFECYIRKDVLALDRVQYQPGILYVDSNGGEYITWIGGEKPVYWVPPFEEYGICERLENTKLHPTNQEFCGVVDEVMQEDEHLRITGWAFLNVEDHYQYRTKVLLKAESGVLWEVSTVEVERLDVALDFPQKHFLRNVGFACNIWTKCLDESEKYEIILRLEDKVGGNVYDVETGVWVGRMKGDGGRKTMKGARP